MNELLISKHEDLFNEILKWRCLTILNLKEIISNDESYDSFRKRVSRLEKGGLLKSILNRGFCKIIYPSDELLKSLGITHFNNENIRHDAFVNSVSWELLKFKKVTSIELPHQYKTKSSYRRKVIEPDAIITLEFNGLKNYVGLEVELWRKDKGRIFEKFSEYAKADEYNYVFYIFSNQASFKSYKERLSEFLQKSDFSHLHDKIINKLVLIYNQEIIKRLDTLDDSIVFFRNETITLKKLLGEKNVQ